MSRAPRAVPSRLRRKRVFKQAKGFYGRRKNNVTTANAAVDRSMQHAYIGRKLRKRNFRSLWIVRISEAVKKENISYSVFINKLQKANITLDRKILSNLIVEDPATFKHIVEHVKGK